MARMNNLTLTSPSSERLETTAAGSVYATVAAVCNAARAAGMTVFARVDHAAGARGAGLELPDEVLLLVGAPKVGTALMQAAPRAGLDLPLHILVWDDAGTTRITWRDPHSLAGDHALAGLEPTLDGMATGLQRVVDASA